MSGPSIAELQVRLNVRGLHYVTSLEEALKRVGGRAIRAQLDAQARAILGLEKASARAAKAAEKAAAHQTRIAAQQARQAEQTASREAKARERSLQQQHRASVRHYQQETRLRAQATKAAEREQARLAKVSGKGGGGFFGDGLLGNIGRLGVAGMVVHRAFRMIGAGIASATEPLIEFQKNVANVRAKGGFTAAETRGLSESFKGISRNSIYSPQEVSSAGIDLAASGIGKGNPSELTSVLPTVLRFAQAGDMQTGEASDILVNAMRQTGLKPKDMEHLGDLMVKTANMSTINVREIAHTLKYAAVPAKQLGVPIEQMFAMIGVLGNLGIKGSMGGTGLRNLVTRVGSGRGADSKRSKAMLSRIGMTKDDLKEGSADLPALLKEMQQRMDAKKFTNSDKVEMASLLFGVPGMTSGGALGEASVNGGSNGIPAFVAALLAAQGELQKTADIMGETLDNKLKRLNGSWNLLKVTMAEKFAPVLANSIDRMTKYVHKIEEWAAKNEKVVTGLAHMAEAFGAGLPKSIEAVASALQLMQPLLDPVGRFFNDMATGWMATVTNQDGYRPVSAEDETHAREAYATAKAKAAGATGTGPYADAKAAAYAEFDANLKAQKDAEKQKVLEDSASRIRNLKAGKLPGDPTVAGDLITGAGPLDRSKPSSWVEVKVSVDKTGELKAIIGKLMQGSGGPGLNVSTTSNL